MTITPASGLAASVSGLAFEPAGPWQEELAELQRRRRFAHAMGGPEALAKFRAKGLLNARERIARLLDADSFRELGALAGKGHYTREGVLERVDPTNAIVGTGRMRGARWRCMSTTSPFVPARPRPPSPTSGSTSNAWRTSCRCP
jgi:acetyl-CoA carboxylase carboxyltransferase component